MNDQIEQALKDCREAWAKHPEATIAWCCHHEVQIEPLVHPVEDRIQYILHNKPEQERVIRFTNFRPFVGLLPRGMQKAYADRQKAYADWQKAYADWQKAYADRQKAYADRQKAYADWQKAYADWQKAYADRQKAYADWQKADADCKDEINTLHKQQVPNNTWNGKSIF
jgi:hypothetical protein